MTRGTSWGEMLPGPSSAFERWYSFGASNAFSQCLRQESEKSTRADDPSYWRGRTVGDLPRGYSDIIVHK